MPAGLAASARSALADPAAPRDAATVVLLRDGSVGVEAYLLRRQQTMTFAAGMYVFPGGGVDDRDKDTTIEWIGPTPQEWADRLGCDVSLARALVCAAVRETFEESGVLLAGPDADSVLADTGDAQWLRDRSSLEAKEISLAQLLQQRGLTLRTDLLRAWTHWITPEFEPRRFDTRFFVAVLPHGQHVGELPGEADRAGWMSLTQALTSVRDGSMAMMPPTQVTCRELSELDRAAEALTAAPARTIAPIMPVLVTEGTEHFLEVTLP